MNLPLLYRASGLTGDPRFRQIAERHAETAQKYLVREDGSCAHIAVFDPQTGVFQKTLGGQGMKEGSSWTRGQSWALYGFALSHRHTKRADFLATAERVARNFLTHVPKNGHIPADFDQPEGCGLEDGSAAAIAACGLFELASLTNKREYAEGADFLLGALAEECDFSAEHDFLLPRCTVAYHDGMHNVPLVYADYFFAEALLKQIGKETFLW